MSRYRLVKGTSILTRDEHTVAVILATVDIVKEAGGIIFEDQVKYQLMRDRRRLYGGRVTSYLTLSLALDYANRFGYLERVRGDGGFPLVLRVPGETRTVPEF